MNKRRRKKLAKQNDTWRLAALIRRVLYHARRLAAEGLTRAG